VGMNEIRVTGGPLLGMFLAFGAMAIILLV
jgi:hypothetical protein